MKILGSKFFGHDAAIYYIDTDKNYVFAASLERYTRIKHDWLDVSPMIADAMAKGSIPQHVDVVVHGFADPFGSGTCVENRFDGVVSCIEETILRAFAQPKYIKDLAGAGIGNAQRFQHPMYQMIGRISDIVRQSGEGANREVVSWFITHQLKSIGMTYGSVEFCDHHLAHATSAYYSRPTDFPDTCYSVTMDGEGDGYSSKAFRFTTGGHIELAATPILKVRKNVKEIAASLGLLYQLFTVAMGWRQNSDEGKVEAFAAFGKPDRDLTTALRKVISVCSGGVFVSPYSAADIFDISFLIRERQRVGDENFCATIQAFLEEVAVAQINSLPQNGTQALCLSGGVAANIIMSMKIYEQTHFKQIHVVPFMGDEGIAAGSAIYTAIKWGAEVDWLRQKHQMPYLGENWSRSEIQACLLANNQKIVFRDLGAAWPEAAGDALADNAIIGVFQGSMEFGPRALGNRSILGNPRDRDVKEKINTRIKMRPHWQPFCPSILEEERERLFLNSFKHKYMATAFRMDPVAAQDIPGAVHIDLTARPQFVEYQDNPNYYRLIKRLKDHTGYGVVLNTSFNLHGRTIVRTPQDAIDDFLDCSLDALFIEGFEVRRSKID